MYDVYAYMITATATAESLESITRLQLEGCWYNTSSGTFSSSSSSSSSSHVMYDVYEYMIMSYMMRVYTCSITSHMRYIHT